MKILVSILENKWAGILCLLIAIANRTVNVFFVSYAGRDKMIGVMQAKTFLEGKGFGIPQYFFAQPHQIVYDYTPYWPPGYPLFLSPLLSFFSYDLYAATTVFDLVFAWVLIFMVRRLAKNLGFDKAGINLLTVISGCFEYSFISESLPTDLPALVFFLVALNQVIIILNNPDSRWPFWVLTGFLLFLPNLFRYAYPALSLGLPMAILLLGFLNKDKSIRIRGWVLFSAVLGFMALFSLYMRWSTGQENYALPTERGYFFSNLLHWHPVAPASFINIPFLSSQALRWLGLSLPDLLSLLETINILFWLGFTGYFIRLFFKEKYFQALAPWKWFLFLGSIGTAGIFASLGFLSLTYKMQEGLLGKWNYIYESRYYAFVFIFLQFVFVRAFFSISKSMFIRIPVLLAGILLLVELTHNLYFHSKVAVNFQRYKKAVYREQDYNLFGELLEKISRSDTGADILVSSYKDNYYPYTATYHGYKGFMDAKTLLRSLPVVKKKTILILVLYSEDVPAFQPLLSSTMAQEQGSFEYTHFYTIVLDP